MNKLNIKLIVGSTRANRFSDKPAQWTFDLASARPDFDVERLDLREYELPFFEEPLPPGFAKDNYTNPAIIRWREKIREADGFIICTPEYNHGYPAVLKNAIDSIYPEWIRKPVGFVSYGSVGGARAVEQLRQVAIEMQMWPIKSAIHIPPDVYRAVMSEPVPANPDLFRPLKEGRVNHVERFFKELLWCAHALKRARSVD